jgi:NAD(P)H-dependent flavin oxidoreductase YrpB (nitropropane dioxygenase family)
MKDIAPAIGEGCKLVFKKTDVCELLGVKYPIVQAPMGPFITTKLCAAVSNAGGLGTVSHTGTFIYLKERDPEFFKQVYNFAPELVEKTFEMERTLGVNTIEELHKVNKLTDKPFAVNVRVAQEQPDAPYLIDALIEEREKDPKLAKNLKVVITSAGNPALYTQKLKNAGLKVIHVVPSVYHAMKAEKSGVDAMVASGHEAGGHVAWEPVHTSVLTPAIRKAVKVPVLSAGGWCDGKGLVAALALGAGAIYMGTRFIATKDSDFAQGYKEAVLKGQERDTLVTAGTFGPMRVIKNEYSLRIEKLLESVTGSFQEKANNPVIVDAKSDASWADSYKYGKTENAPVLTGEVQVLVDDLPTVKELIDRIIREAEEVITKKLPSFIA